MNRAVFLDRDGVIVNNSDHYYIFKPEDMELVEGIYEALKELQDKGYQLYLVTNQGGIAKGLYTKEDVLALHQKLTVLFAEKGIKIRDIAFCPHHDQIEKCLCRKPGSLMLEKLIAKYGIDAEHSFFIGDSETDMQAARKVGIKGIRIDANQNMKPFITEL